MYCVTMRTFSNAVLLLLYWWAGLFGHKGLLTHRRPELWRALPKIIPRGINLSAALIWAWTRHTHIEDFDCTHTFAFHNAGQRDTCLCKDSISHRTEAFFISFVCGFYCITESRMPFVIFNEYSEVSHR